MNNKIVTLFIAAILMSNVSFAKIWRVNNNTGITADFTTAQAAHDGATAGDTIHLEPSITDYGNLTTSKKLVWISIGDFLDIHPGLQYSPNSGRLLSVTINAGSQNSVFSVALTTGGYGLNCNTTGVTFLRCSGWNIGLSNSSDAVVIDCFITTAINASGSQNVIISNNIVGYNISVDATSSAVITNNVINYSTGYGGNINNSVIQNNIFNKGGAYTFTNCNSNNNMTSDGMLPAGNGNQNNVDMTIVFAKNTGTTDADFVLKAGSPAIGTGYGGADMGAFGGTTPFIMGLQPAVPAIYQINAPGAPSGSTMNVTFSTKSNN